MSRFSFVEPSFFVWRNSDRRSFGGFPVVEEVKQVSSSTQPHLAIWETPGSDIFDATLVLVTNNSQSKYSSDFYDTAMSIKCDSFLSIYVYISMMMTGTKNGLWLEEKTHFNNSWQMEIVSCSHALEVFERRESSSYWCLEYNWVDVDVALATAPAVARDRWGIEKLRWVVRIVPSSSESSIEDVSALLIRKRSLLQAMLWSIDCVLQQEFQRSVTHFWRVAEKLNEKTRHTTEGYCREGADNKGWLDHEYTLLWLTIWTYRCGRNNE